MTVIQRLTPNKRGRDFAVGDIHAHVTRLRAALREIQFDPKVDRLIATGDLVDRGEETEQVLELLDEPWFYSVLGNHDDLAIRLATNNHFRLDDYIKGGGQWNVDNPAHVRRRYAYAFSQLPFVIEVPTDEGIVGIVHADCHLPTWTEFTQALQAQTEGTQVMKSAKHEAMWNRQRLKRGEQIPVPDIRAIVVGHCTVPTAKVLGNVHYIDTGGWTSRRLFTFLRLDSLVAITIRTKE